MGQQFTSIAKGLNLGGFQESKEEFLEKGKKAQIGEIREWKGQKFQKQPNGGWVPVKQGTKKTEKEDKSSEVRKDLPKMEHGGDEKKDAEAHEKALDQLKKEGFVVGKDNLLHHEDGRVAKINTKTGEWEISKEASEKHGFETEPEEKEDKNVESSFGKLMSKSDEEIAKILQEAVGLKASIWKRGDKQAPSEGDFWLSTSTEGVNNGLRKRLMIRPITKEGRERLTDDSVKKKLKKLVGTELGAWSGRGADGERVFQGYKIWEPDADFERKKSFVKRFFDPQEMVDGYEESFDLSDGIEEFERWLGDRQFRDDAIDVLVDQTGMNQEDAMKFYDEKVAEALEEVKRNPEKYGFEPENKTIAGVKDWIGDEASDQEISDVLDAVADFVPLSMLKIQANSPLQFGEKVYDRADEIMEKYREHFDHWDGTDSMPDKQLRKILVAIMYDKRNPRA